MAQIATVVKPIATISNHCLLRKPSIPIIGDGETVGVPDPAIHFIIDIAQTLIFV